MDTEVRVIPLHSDTLTVTDAEPPHVGVDATGAVRRLRALVAIGHSQTALAARLGVRVGNLSPIIHGRKARVSTKTHAAVCAVFVELWATPVAAHSGNRSRVLAKAHGWVGPLAWDDIDDPAEVPNVRGRKPVQSGPEILEQPDEVTVELDEIAIELAMNGEPVKLTKDERWQAVTRLHSRRWSDKYIAATLHITDRTVLRIRQRLELEAFDFSEIRQVESA